MADTLVIGYGSDLRGDDAAGRHVARRVAELGLSGVATLEAHQLTPELAATLAAHRRVIFVDAAAGAAEVAVAALGAAPGSRRSTHHATPAGLLSLARIAFGAAPSATMVTVPAGCFEMGAGLSPLAGRGVEQATAAIVDLVSHPAGEPSAAG